jgi:hypothetical protein
VDELVDEYTWRTPLQIVAALHYLVLDGRASWDDWRDALTGEEAFVRRFVAEQGVQTNEVQRSWMLLPCFLEVARRSGAAAFDLVELGPSAGFNLEWDRYGYRYRRGAWGREDARLVLQGEERRAVPSAVLELAPRVRSRVGIDRSPLDVTTDEDARLLRSFVWPDQTWRMDQLDRAISALREEPPDLRRGDVADELPDLLAGRPRDGLTVVFQTAVLGYLPRERRELVYETLAAAGRERPLAFVESARPQTGEHTFWSMVVQVWPEGERVEVAHADFHGAWLDWHV